MAPHAFPFPLPKKRNEWQIFRESRIKFISLKVPLTTHTPHIIQEFIATQRGCQPSRQFCSKEVSVALCNDGCCWLDLSLFFFLILQGRHGWVMSAYGTLLLATRSFYTNFLLSYHFNLQFVICVCGGERKDMKRRRESFWIDGTSFSLVVHPFARKVDKRYNDNIHYSLPRKTYLDSFIPLCFFYIKVRILYAV